MALPNIVIIKSVAMEKYMRCLTGKEEKVGQENREEFKRGVKLQEDKDISSPLIKFQVVTATSNPELVHIRCCYTNKYLVMGTTTTYYDYIQAVAENPIEDQTSNACTLFKPIRATDDEFKGDTQMYRLLHVRTKRYLIYRMMPDTRNDHLSILSETPRTYAPFFDVFKIMDFGSIVIFPEQVAFKQHGSQSKFLNCKSFNDHPYLQFLDGTDEGDTRVANVITTVGDGFVRIKNLSTGKFWRRSPNWIWADSNKTEDDNSSEFRDTIFWPVKLGDNVVALRSVANDRFLKGITQDGVTGCLNAAEEYMTNEVKLEVVETLIERNVYDIEYHTEVAKVYNVIEKDIVTSRNTSYTKEDTVTLKFSHKKSNSKTIGGSVSLKLGAKATLKLDVIPTFLGGQIELSAELTGTVQWGTTDLTEKVTETMNAVKVAPRTRKTVTLVAKHGICEVPFSYTRRDYLRNKRAPEIKRLHDGIYKGIDSTEIDYDTKEEPLPASD
ncbi:uncharacterized protein LOC115695613 [Cannabis sativa]|uniref:uncharacterized protein LOC115695613 n=1 Tax=Cannabis sativa TaxID=3483 RepID=UPI0029C9CC33|nr:uncharacterized protein LOC115695613 [Cannabis sativa]